MDFAWNFEAQPPLDLMGNEEAQVPEEITKLGVGEEHWESIVSILTSSGRLATGFLVKGESGEKMQEGEHKRRRIETVHCLTSLHTGGWRNGFRFEARGNVTIFRMLPVSCDLTFMKGHANQDVMLCKVKPAGLMREYKVNKGVVFHKVDVSRLPNTDAFRAHAKIVSLGFFHSCYWKLDLWSLPPARLFSSQKLCAILNGILNNKEDEVDEIPKANYRTLRASIGRITHQGTTSDGVPFLEADVQVCMGASGSLGLICIPNNWLHSVDNGDRKLPDGDCVLPQPADVFTAVPCLYLKGGGATVGSNRFFSCSQPTWEAFSEAIPEEPAQPKKTSKYLRNASKFWLEQTSPDKLCDEASELEVQNKHGKIWKERFPALYAKFREYAANHTTPAWRVTDSDVCPDEIKDIWKIDSMADDGDEDAETNEDPEFYCDWSEG